ncbi:MAG: hypothetical protein AYK18_03770 [Theionarchaea archaeon DG-70]|nr:MAG: hypothetical protein AYK18_03770 [Theionarchaea archaeon DG-70]
MRIENFVELSLENVVMYQDRKNRSGIHLCEQIKNITPEMKITLNRMSTSNISFIPTNKHETSEKFIYYNSSKKTTMKSSIFNVFIPAKKGYALYNTLTESIMFCDQELKEVLEHDRVSALTPEYISALRKNGVLVEDTADELQVFQYRYNCRAFDTKEIQFVAVTTYRCNLACPYCYEGKGEVYSQEMNKEMAERIVKAMQNRITQLQSRYCTLILFGGEPLLNMDVGVYLVDTMREWCTARGVALRTFMVTNGTLLTEKKASLVSEFIDGVQLTLDGSQPYHDTTRIHKNGKGTYTEVISAMKNALTAGMNVSLRVQVSKENWQHLGDLFIDIAPSIEMGRVTINIAPLSRYSGMCTNFSSHFLEKEEQETVLPAVLQYTPNVKPVPNYLPCVAYTNNLIFDGKGNIYRCITTVGEDSPVGYLTEQGDIVWNPELYTFMARTPLKIPECETCTYLPLCGGGCPRTAYLTHGTYESSVCGGSRRVYYETIKTYLKRKFPDRF